MANAQDPLKSQTMKFTLASKNVLTLEEAELYELSELAGVIIDQKVFKIILDLLKMNVTPSAIVQMLKHMRSHGKTPSVSKDTQSKPRLVKQQQKSETGIAQSARSESNSKVRGHSAPRTGNRSARS